MISKIINFLKADIWRFRLQNISGPKNFLIKKLRVVVLAIRAFDEDKCMLRASAMTFYSMLSVVPVVAMAFGVAKGFGFEKLLETQLYKWLPGQEEVVVRVIEFANSMLAKTRGGLIAGIGVVLLFWTVIKLLGNVETSFNDIWQIKSSRSFSRKFSDYLSVMLICPFLLIFSSSAMVFLINRMTFILKNVSCLELLGPAVSSALSISQYLFVWILFAFIYIFMPNTKVNIKSGIIAGIIAGTFFNIIQYAYVKLQVGVAQYNAIYGSFAVLPLFLVWLQTSWLIVLLGAEISFAHQNVATYEYEPDCLRISYTFKRLLTLAIVHRLVKNFSEGEKPWTDTQISCALEIPIRLVHIILDELVEAGVISESSQNRDRSVGYQPARSIEKITIRYVIDALENCGNHDIPVAESKEIGKISECLNNFSNKMNELPDNVVLKDI
jgi:membrane protein